MKRWVTVLLLALAIAAFLSPFASSHPDGLERVAEDLNFVQKGEQPAFKLSPMPDYTVGGISDERLSTAVAGVAGTLITLAFAWGWAKWVSGWKEE
ncbi:MAG: PDGLE domain-containing protein [Bacillota bacterium]|nr:MAG: hypothetical protein DIU66_06200 [Bacillota bacterium]